MDKREKCIKFILNKKYGDTIKMREVADILEYDIYNEKERKRYQKAFGKIKKALVGYGYVLKTVAGVGYYILKPKQISGYCYHTYIKKVENILEKSYTTLNYMDKSELSEIRMEECRNMTKLNIDLINETENTIIDSDYFNNKEKYDSLED